MRPRHFLRCLGYPTLLTPNGELIRIRTKKHLGLLVYLAVEPGRSHNRDVLAALLWPKAKPAEARHSLSTALSLFRARLGRDAIDASREKISLKRGRLELDLDRLVDGDALGDEYTPPVAIGGFLDGFDIADAPEFALWKDRQQARLLPAIKRVIVTLIDHHRRTGEFQRIEELAEQMLALDDLSEEAIRAKIEARAISGDRITALRLFEDWKTKLASELQAEPSEALRRIAARLRQSDWQSTTGFSNRNQAKEQYPEPLFVNRLSEYRILYEAWERARNSVRVPVLVTGDSGVGKTTLVQRLRTAATLEGALVSRAQCYDIEHEVPYSLLSTLVLDILIYPSASGTAPEALAELARTVPEIRKRFPSVPIPTESVGEAARIRLTEAFIELLIATGEDHPILLIIDDFHFADDASLAVLHLVIRRMANTAMTVVLVTRPQELGHSPCATRLLNSINSLGLLKLEISPLANNESQTLLEALIPPERPQPGGSARRALLQAAAGYPMALELLAQDWQTHGHQSLALSINAMTKNLSGDGTAAALYQTIIDRLTTSLEPTTLRALHLAAILGHRLNDIELYSLAGLNTNEAITALNDLTTNHILRDDSHHLEFKNELIRNAVYLAIPSITRAALHGQIADRLAQSPWTSSTTHGLEIAWHCIRGGRDSEATPYLLNGARDALSHGALHAAENALITALPLLEGTAREDAAILLAETLQEQGRWVDSLRWLNNDSGNEPSDIRTVLALHANCFTNSQSTDTIRTNIETLIEILKTSHDLITRIKAARVASRLLTELRDKATAIRLLRHIETLPSDNTPERESIELSIARALCLYHAHERDNCLAVLLTASMQLRSTGRINSTLCSLLLGLGAIRCQQGKYTEARNEFAQGHEIATRIGNDLLQTHSAAQIALCCCRLGQYSTALEWTDKIKNINSEFSGYVEIQSAYYSALAHTFCGRPELAATAMTTTDSRIPDCAPNWLLQAWQLFKANILYITGHKETALSLARTGVGHPTPTLHSPFFAGEFSRWLALTTNSPASHHTAKQLVAELSSKISTFDALDQVEIMCAEYNLGRDKLSDIEQKRKHTLILRRLEQLPLAVHQQLQALGMLQP